MRALIQRVSRASVTLAQGRQCVAETGAGLLVFLAVAPQDGHEQVSYMARKIAEMRIFEDEEGKMNKSLLDTEGEILLVSQFTLLADCSKGRRPAFNNVMPPDEARKIIQTVAQELRQRGLKVEQGVFGADMQVELINDGPVTIVLDT